MKRTDIVGRQAGWKASLKHGLVGLLLVMIFSQGNVLAGSRRIVGPAASDVAAMMGRSVRGVIRAGAGIVRDVHDFYEITQLRNLPVEEEATPVPISSTVQRLELCKAKAAPALPAMDKSRS